MAAVRGKRTSPMGRCPMARPDDDRPFPARWHHLVRLLLVDPSVKHVAHAAVDHADFVDGSECRPGNERLVRETGYSRKTVGVAWSVLQALGMAEQVTWHVSYKKQADEYDLAIPLDWESRPVLGPSGRKFTCQYCGKLFNPPGCCTVKADGQIGWPLYRMVFCPAPRATAGCFQKWNQRQVVRGSAVWQDLALEDKWKMFRLARNDDW